MHKNTFANVNRFNNELYFINGMQCYRLFINAVAVK